MSLLNPSENASEELRRGKRVSIANTPGVWLFSHYSWREFNTTTRVRTCWVDPGDSVAQHYANRLPYGMLETPCENVAPYTPEEQ